VFPRHSLACRSKNSRGHALGFCHMPTIVRFPDRIQML
jgi:hypothetical protein